MPFWDSLFTRTSSQPHQSEPASSVESGMATSTETTTEVSFTTTMANNDHQHQCQNRSRTHVDSTDSTSKVTMVEGIAGPADAATACPNKKMTNDGTDKSEAAASFATASLATDSLDAPKEEEEDTPFFEAQQFDSKDLDEQGEVQVESSAKTVVEGNAAPNLEKEQTAGSAEEPSSSAPVPSESVATSDPTPSANEAKATNGSSNTKRSKSRQQQKGNPFGSPKPASSSSGRRKRKATPDNVSGSQKRKEENSNNPEKNSCNSKSRRGRKAVVQENDDTGNQPTAQNDGDTQKSTTANNNSEESLGKSGGKRNSARERSPSEKLIAELVAKQRKIYPKRQRSPSMVFAGMDNSDEEDDEEDGKPAKRSKNSKSSKRKESLEVVAEEEQGEAPTQQVNNPDPFDAVADDEQLQEIKRAVKRSNVPNPGSPGYKVHRVMDGLRRDSVMDEEPTMTTLSASSNSLFSLAADTNLRILYHLTRAHLLNGKIVEALVVCHDVLKSTYAQVEAALPKAQSRQSDFTDDAALLLLREKIAGTWCLYAHLFLQITETDMFFGVTDNNNGKVNGSISREDFSHNAMEDRLWDHAIALLSFCTCCPLVGNHAAITLALSRLRSRRRERNRFRRFHSAGPMKGTKSYFSKLVGTAAHWKRNLGRANKICRGGLDRCIMSRPIPTTLVVAREGPYDGVDEILDLETTAGHVSDILSNIRRRNMKWNTCNPEENDATKATVATAFLTDVLEIPQKLQADVKDALSPSVQKKYKSSSLPYVYEDSASARLICREMNCLSRLQQSIGDFDGSAELRMISDPDHLECLGHNVSGVDGVAWGDFIFFQSMSIALVKESEADNYKYYQKTPIAAADFFKHTGVDSTWKRRFAVDGYAKFPLKLVFTNVEHACSKCDALLEEKELESHVCLGDESRFSGQSLQSPWAALASALNVRDAPSDREGGDEKSKSSKVFDLSCACRKCCIQSNLYDNLQVQECEKCEIRFASVEESTHSTVHETVAGADVVVDGDGLYESVRDEVNNLLLGEHDEAAKHDDNVVEDVPAKLKTAQEDLDVPAKLKTAQEDLDVPAKLKTAQEDLDVPAKLKTAQEDLDVPAKLKTDRGDFDVPAKLKTAREEFDVPLARNVVAGRKKEKPKPKKRPFNGKRNVKTALQGLFEEAADDDDDQTVIVPTQSWTSLVAARTYNANEDSRQMQEAEEAIRKKNEKKIAGLSVDYPCRKCFKDGYSSEKDRDLHELSCGGRLGGSSVCLSENWPPLASNLSSTEELPRQGIKRPLAEGPTPRKPDVSGIDGGGEHLPTETLASTRCKNNGIRSGAEKDGSNGARKQLKSLAAPAFGPVGNKNGQRCTRSTGNGDDNKRRRSSRKPNTDQSGKDQSLALASVPLSEKTAMVGS